jgi:hypothetical protein
LSSRWFISQTRIVRVGRNRPFKITAELINKLIADEQYDFEKFWTGDGWLKNSKATVLENYPLKKIFKEGGELELSIYFSLASQRLLEAIKGTLVNELNISSVCFNTFPFLVFHVFRHLLDTEKGFVLIDVTGETSEATIIRNNIIEETISLPKGEVGCLKSLSATLRLHPAEARARFSQYQRNELGEIHLSKIERGLQDAHEEWTKCFKKMIKEVSSERDLPQNFYLIGPARPFKEAIEKILKNNTQILAPESLKHYFEFTKGFSQNKDITLLISTLFANSIPL